MMKHGMLAAALVLGTASLTAPATAQVQVPAGLVVINVGNVVLEDILTDIEIEALNDLDVLNNNQIQVQVPIGVAANVCPNVNAAVLARAAQTADAVCTAESGSQALAQAIRKQYLRK